MVTSRLMDSPGAEAGANTVLVTSKTPGTCRIGRYNTSMSRSNQHLPGVNCGTGDRKQTPLDVGIECKNDHVALIDKSRTQSQTPKKCPRLIQRKET